MCLKYNRKGGIPYARLCYLTGQAGVHRDLTPEQAANWEWGMFHGEGKRARGATSKRARRTMITFDVGNSDGAVIAEMARYMDARFTVDPNNGHVVIYADKGISPNMIERAESFGWREWVSS